MLQAVPFTGGASFKVEKAPSAVWKKGSRELQKRSKIAPPSVPPPEALYDFYSVYGQGFFAAIGRKSPARLFKIRILSAYRTFSAMCCKVGYRTVLRDVLQSGVSHSCACVNQKPGGFSEQLPERFPELMGTHMEDFPVLPIRPKF